MGEDGRWTALGMRNRTVHAFAVNLYGAAGCEAVKTHLEARVRNVELVVRLFSWFFLTMLHISYLLSLIRSRIRHR